MGLEVGVSGDGGDGDVGGRQRSAVSWWGMGFFLFSLSFSRFRGF